MKKISKYFKKFSLIVTESEVSTYTGSASFFSILSIFPIILLIVNILPITNISPDLLFKFVGDFLPSFVVTICKDAYYQFGSFRGALISITIVMVLYSAGNGVWSLRNGFNAINGVREKRNWILVHAIAIMYTLIFIVLILFSLVFIVLGNKLYNAFDANFYDISFIYVFLTKFRFMFIWIILLVLFMCMYKALSAKKLYFTAQFPGALFASILWSLLSMFFSEFIDNVGATGIYGTFATLIFSFFWVYWSIYFIFLGAIINTFFENYFKARRKRKKEKKLFKKEQKRKRKLLKKGIIEEESLESELDRSPEAHTSRYE